MGRDLTEAIAGKRPCAFDTIEASQRGLDGIGHTLFDFHGAQRGHDRVDLNLLVRDVRRHVDRQQVELPATDTASTKVRNSTTSAA